MEIACCCALGSSLHMYGVEWRWRYTYYSHGLVSVGITRIYTTAIITFTTTATTTDSRNRVLRIVCECLCTGLMVVGKLWNRYANGICV